jgi:hypothetical protein
MYLPHQSICSGVLKEDMWFALENLGYLGPVMIIIHKTNDFTFPFLVKRNM